MFYNTKSLLALLFSIVLTLLTSENTPTIINEKAPISYLELFQGKGLEPVLLGHPYYSPTEEEKRNCIYLQEGCYTILENTNKNACALVGPLMPCQLFLLSINNNKTIVAHVSVASNFSLLLSSIKEQFPEYDSSKITGKLFTNKYDLYDQSKMQINGKVYSFQKCYENRTQTEELKNNKEKILATFAIQNKNQIIAHKFNKVQKPCTLGHYEFADVYVLIKINERKEAIVFNTCPMKENFFINTNNLPLLERLKKFTSTLESLPKSSFQIASEMKRFSYGSIAFEYIPHPNNG